MMCLKVFSKCVSKCFQNSPTGFKVFSNYVFQSVLKIPHRFQSFFKLCVSKCFQNSPQVSMIFILCVSKCFQNYIQVSKYFQMMYLKVFSKCVSKCFQNLHRFQWFLIVCFKVFSKFPIGFNAFFKLCVSKFPIGFKVFSNCVFPSVFKIPHKFQ